MLGAKPLTQNAHKKIDVYWGWLSIVARSGGVYGYRQIQADLRDLGECCGKHRVARLVRQGGLRSKTGYRRHPGHYGVVLR